MTKIEDLPQPTGWRILLEMPEPEEETKHGIIIPKMVQDNEKILTFMGKVVLMGPACYVDREDVKFGGRWCEPGDTVLLSKYAGTKMIVDGREYRILNDDEVQAKIPNPSIVKRG